MKKLLLILVFVIVTITTQAAPLWYHITGLSTRDPNGEWSTWVYTDLSMAINFDTKHIEIYTENIQIFDYSGFVTSSIDKGTMYKSLATDSQFRTVEVYLLIYDSGIVYFKVAYNNLEYVYNVEVF
ncbi:MAG: hypothetical protein ACOH2V_00510 [Candidatus Saccharimonadaceae bacterium]